MGTRSVAYVIAACGQLATLAGAIMLSRLLVRLGVGRATPAEALLELTTGAGAAWFWLSLIGAGVWGGAWLLAERSARPAASRAPGRLALLTIGQMAALAAVLLQAILLITLLLTPARPAGSATQAVELAAGGALALTFWGFLRWNAAKDGDFGDESAAGANWPRLYYYGGAAITLALFLIGLMELLRIIVGVATGIAATDVTLAANRARFAPAAAFALVGAPAWWALWWAQQARVASDPAARRAGLRRLYLYAIILVTAVAFFFGLGMSIFGALTGRNLALVATWAPIALISLVCLTGHLLTLRADERALAAASAQGFGRPEQAEAVARGRPIAAAASQPRHFPRETLPPTARPDWPSGHVEGSALTRPPIILVVDGRDGALGAKLLAALADGLPHAILWPLGFNAAAHIAMLDAMHRALGGAPPAVPADAPNRAALIVGPSDMLIPGGLAGEVTAEAAAAIADSPAAKLLLPPRDPALRWVAAPAWPAERWVENAVIEAANVLGAGR
jgi:hypothetical protein